MRNFVRVVLAAVVVAGCFHGVSFRPAWSQEDDVSADSMEDDDSDADLDDIEIGELGSDGDDSSVSSRRGRRGGGGAARAPRATIDPQIRLAVAHRFTKDFSAELYGRTQLGAITRPLESRSSTVAGGLILNRRIGSWVWTTSIELAEHHRDFYDRRTYNGYEPGMALARSFNVGTLGGAGGIAVAITPRVAVNYRLADEDRYERIKTELMAPVTFRLTRQLDFVVTPRIDWETYTDRPDHRRDMTTYFAGGLKYEIAKGVTLAGTIGYESKRSNIDGLSNSRWKFAPQLSLKKEM